MAILIKGMDFPKTCMTCDLEIVDDEDYTTYCPLIYKGYTGKCREDGRLPDCPLVEAAEVQDAVSRQAAIDEFDKGAWGVEWDKVLAKAMIGSLPSAQQEIIRCKDCKWYGRADKRRFYRGMDCLQKRIDTIVPDKDFCSRAERRTDK